MIITGKDGKIYASEKECLEADAKYDAIQKEKEEAANREKAEISKRKKVLSTNIENAEKDLDEAYKAYDEAKSQAAKIMSEAKAQADKILKESANSVQSASKKRLEAIKAFNNEFGVFNVYTKRMSDNEALNEYNKAIRTFKDFESILNKFWW